MLGSIDIRQRIMGETRGASAFVLIHTDRESGFALRQVQFLYIVTGDWR